MSTDTPTPKVPPTTTPIFTPTFSPVTIAAIRAIVNVFESGTVRGQYDQVTLIPGDTGGLTYGRSQTTRASGNLYTLVQMYCSTSGARYTEQLRPYLDRLKRCDPSLDRDAALKQVLRQAGQQDPTMRSVQDSFFDRVYLKPALKIAASLGITTALGTAVVYDSIVHGSFQRIADRTSGVVGSVNKAGEKTWVTTYLKQRYRWLQSCKDPLPATVYRIDALLGLVEARNWDLVLPFVVRGLVVSEKSMGIESEGWTLLLNEREIGQTWQNPKDDFRNYFPARRLLECLYGTDQTAKLLSFQDDQIRWNDKVVPVPVILRDGTAWAQVRGLAGWAGLTVDRDEEKRSIFLRRSQK